MASGSGRKTIRPTDPDFENIAQQWLDESSYAGSESSEDSNHEDFADVDINDSAEDDPNYVQISQDEYDSSESDVEDSSPERNGEFMVAPNGKKWAKHNSKKATKISRHNIVRFTPGPARKGEVFTHMDAWKKFITSAITEEIILCTNREASRVCLVKGKRWQPIEKDEMDAFLGLLLMAGVEKSWDVPVRELFLDKLSNPIYRACMSVNRFEDIRRFLRFDDKRTRNQRLETDKLAPISYIWNLFLIQCKTIMVPKLNVTIDEQLVAFRGRCGFIQYMPSKPAKYGIKFFWLCESEKGYAVNGDIYTGKKPGGEVQRNLGMHTVHSLINCIQNTSRNLTVDNFFTSVELFEKLLSVGITAVGTIRKNKRDIPKEMQAEKNREVFSSRFAFQNNCTLVSYVPRRNKAVLLLSTLHNNEEVDSTQKKKPEIINYYNNTKGGVDIMDQKVANYTVKRQTKRWPVVVWSNMMDVAAHNAFLLFIEEHKEYEKNRSDKRRLFLKELAKQMILPYMERRSKNPNLQKSILEDVEKFIPRELTDKPANKKSATKKRCFLCPTKKDRKCDRLCTTCGNPICKEHTIYSCTKCK